MQRQRCRRGSASLADASKEESEDKANATGLAVGHSNAKQAEDELSDPADDHYAKSGKGDEGDDGAECSEVVVHEISWLGLGRFGVAPVHLAGIGENSGSGLANFSDSATALGNGLSAAAPVLNRFQIG